MRIKHYYAFDEQIQKDNDLQELNSDNWDLLRTDNTPGPFSIEKEIDDYERNCNNSSDYKNAAEIICSMIKDYKLGNRMVSLGCGKGIVEWHIKRLMPELYVKCTDYAEKGIDQLRKVFVDCDEFGTFDMLLGDYGTWTATEDIILMYRVSTEFSGEQWKMIFEKMYAANIKYIIFIPAEIMTLRIAFNEKRGLLLNLLSRKKITFCGWMYSWSEYLKFFRGQAGRDEKGRYQIVFFKKYKNTRILLLERTNIN